MRRVTLVVNGEKVTAEIEQRMQLVDFLRDVCLLTGTHVGCEHGVCGACTLLLDGAPARSCIAYAAACEGADVRSIEGLQDDPIMQRLRAAFTEEHALQCGYCTPGMLVTARDIVLRVPEADAAKSAWSWPGICAAVPGMPASCGPSAACCGRMSLVQTTCKSRCRN